MSRPTNRSAYEKGEVENCSPPTLLMRAPRSLLGQAETKRGQSGLGQRVRARANKCGNWFRLSRTFTGLRRWALPMQWGGHDGGRRHRRGHLMNVADMQCTNLCLLSQQEKRCIRHSYVVRNVQLALLVMQREGNFTGRKIQGLLRLLR